MEDRTRSVELTYEELAALIDLEEDYLVLKRDWTVGDPHPLGEHADSATTKIRDAFGDLYSGGRS